MRSSRDRQEAGGEKSGEGGEKKKKVEKLRKKLEEEKRKKEEEMKQLKEEMKKNMEEEAKTIDEEEEEQEEEEERLERRRGVGEERPDDAESSQAGQLRLVQTDDEDCVAKFGFHTKMLDETEEGRREFATRLEAVADKEDRDLL
ncbi:hypothetical protein CBR_g2922 [Chara braunii]|uniref:Uncharacterized protein n=1 Tax=Chara braunii TaxID=69332 RepID=A0A388KEA2_CHABU|nr:hypothetical protein CBR_g2922 [Chara braunii]|eukprot:GBG68379.1 hypothetical protein CBR_g2922 [Chara braunii]